MPERETMVVAHRNRHFFRGLGIGLWALLLCEAIAGMSPPFWAGATGAAGLFFLAFFWCAYVPVIMSAPRLRREMSAEQASEFLAPDDDVAGISLNGEARAYSRKELTRPHVIVEEVGGKKMAITYCILCNTAVAFHTAFHGWELEFLPITAYNNNIIFHDPKSDNYIQQLDGRVIAGPDSGQRLEAQPVALTSWEAWKTLHPDTRFVHLPAAGIRDRVVDWMLGWMVPLSGLLRRKGPWHPVNHPLDGRLPAMSPVLGLEHDGQRAALSMAALREKKVINTFLGEEPIAIFYDAKLDVAAVYFRRVDGEVINFMPLQNPEGGLVAQDAETGNLWNIEGRAPADGRQLRVLPHFSKLFWFSWSAFKPQTLVSN